MRNGCRTCTLVSLFSVPSSVCVLPPLCFVLSHLEGRPEAQGVAAPPEQNALRLVRGLWVWGRGEKPFWEFVSL